MDYEKLYKESMRRTTEFVKRGSMTADFAKAIFDDFEMESEDEKIRKIITLSLEECVHSDIIRDYEKDDAIAWLEKQGEKKETLCDKCKKEQPSHSCQDITALGRCALEMQGKKKSADNVEPFDKYKGLTDFERTLADICIGWIGEEHGWKQYIKDNADILLNIAIKKFNSVQDANFEQNPAWREEDEKMLAEIVKDLQVCKSRDISRVAKDDYQNEIDWLKSLKERYTWKPSDLQIKALEYYTEIGCVDKKGFYGSELVKLLEELKKL